jgi:hypothetical protein
MKIALKLIPAAFLLSVIILTMSCRPEPVAPEEARVIILQPTAGSTLNAGDVTVRVYPEYFKLTDNTGQPNIHGEGHIIYYLDSTPPLIKGESALTAEGTYNIASEKIFTWTDVAPGDHDFWVQLVNNDNSVLEPPAAVRVPVRLVAK